MVSRPRACILGCAGLRLDIEERALFRELRPWGFILFARNVGDREQLRRLTDDLRAAVDDDAALVFVDQEGGRVQRLAPPMARRRAPAARFGARYAERPDEALEAAWLNHRLIADELRRVGIDADCAPCVDVLRPQTHAVIGDRAFGTDPAAVAALGRAAVGGLIAGGVVPVVKHIPGHGAAEADSHRETPHVDAARDELDAIDFAPFRALADVPAAMTAHVVYRNLDGEACATLSASVISEVIRSAIGFEGLLISDDLSMQALEGDLTSRARRALAAGCDVNLHGNGALVGEPVRDLAAELRAVAEASPELTGSAARRAATARETSRHPAPFDLEAAEARLAALGFGSREAG